MSTLGAWVGMSSSRSRSSSTASSTSFMSKTTLDLSGTTNGRRSTAAGSAGRGSTSFGAPPICAGRNESRLRAASSAASSDGTSRWATPLTVVCRREPPMSSAEASSPVAAFTIAGSGQEHLGLVGDHDRPVGEGRRVGGRAGAWSEDQRDLRHLVAGLDVEGEDAAAAVQGVDAVVDARAAGVVDVDDRVALVDGEALSVHHRLGEDRADRPGAHRRVVTDHDDGVAAGQAPSGDDAAAARGSRLAQRRQGHERARIHEGLGPLECGVDARALGLDPGELLVASLREDAPMGRVVWVEACWVSSCVTSSPKSVIAVGRQNMRLSSTIQQDEEYLMFGSAAFLLRSEAPN